MSSLEQQQQQKRTSLHLATDAAIGAGAGAESAMPASSPATTPLGSAAGAAGFLPDMPQWKKDLIQRRKTNVARTNNATLCSPTATDVGGCQVALTEPSGEFRQYPEVLGGGGGSGAVGDGLEARKGKILIALAYLR